MTARLFLSTPSARRATLPHRVYEHGRFISIHALREEGDFVCVLFYHDSNISIHALREEGDALHLPSGFRGRQFLSTPSARRAT